MIPGSRSRSGACRSLCRELQLVTARRIASRSVRVQPLGAGLAEAGSFGILIELSSTGSSCLSMALRLANFRCTVPAWHFLRSQVRNSARSTLVSPMFPGSISVPYVPGTTPRAAGNR